jgi:hypothetical protein
VNKHQAVDDAAYELGQKNAFLVAVEHKYESDCEIDHENSYKDPNAAYQKALCKADG